MTESLWPAPAKLNLFLHVVGRRPDGYHELQTAFQLLDFCDGIGVTVRGDGRIERPAGPPGVPEAQDLTVRAAQALKDRTGTPLGATLRVAKRIPLGGGLGGGSSDAATVLVALNTLWGLELHADELAAIGLPLGADVPVFVRGRSAWGEGVGERLVPLELPARHYVVIHPGVAVATRDVFQAPELTRDSAPITLERFLAFGGRNDCEAVVRRRYPEVGRALEWLDARAPARLTGTGSCIFAACRSEAEARRIVAEVPPEWSGFVARGLNESPLLDAARRLGAAAGN